MQPDEKKVAELMAEIAHLELHRSALFQLVGTAYLFNSMYQQKEDWFRKHYPFEYARCQIDFDLVEIAKKIVSLKDFDSSYIGFLN